MAEDMSLVVISQHIVRADIEWCFVIEVEWTRMKQIVGDRTNSIWSILTMNCVLEIQVLMSTELFTILV